jgi:flagellar motor switch protein FliG
MSDPGEISGAQRAAAFLLTLEKEEAAAVVKHLDESVIVEVVEAMSSLEPDMTSEEAVRELQKELIRSLRRPSGARVRSETELKTMLEGTLGKQQAEELFETIHVRLLQERPFLGIEREPAKNIAIALEGESDAVAALVLTHIDPSLSAEVLGSFEEERALTVVRRMATLIPPGFSLLLKISEQLSQRLREIASGPVAADPATRLRSIAEVLSFSEPRVESAVLEGLGEIEPDMAATIRDFMFVWEDLSGLDNRAMQKILASVDTRTLSIALKACSPKVEGAIMNNLSSRVREMVADERDLAGAMPMTEVLQSREEILKAVRMLMASGELKQPRAGEDLVT